MKYIPSMAISFAAALIMCVFIPETTYMRNANEFVFDHIELLKTMSSWCVFIFFAFLLLQAILNPLLPSEKIPAFGKIFAITPLQIILLTLLALLFIEGAFVSHRLPIVSGQAGLFCSPRRATASCAAWAGCIVFAILWWRRLSRRFFTLAALVFLFFAAMLGDAFLGRDSKIADVPDVLGKLAYHPGENIIIIVADALPTHAVEEAVSRDPEIREKLNGFTLFANNLGTGHQTSWAIPALLQGAVFDGGTYTDFSRRAFSSPSSFPKRFMNRGFDVFMHSLLPRYTAVTSSREDIASEASGVPAVVNARMYVQFCFRFIPYVFKERLGEYFFMPETVGDTPADYYGKGMPVEFQKLVSGMERKSSKATAQFIHYFGAHAPYIRQADGGIQPRDLWHAEEGLFNTAGWILRNFAYFLDKLRERGLFDSATVVLAADHGDGGMNQRRSSTSNITSFNTPVFMIKPPHAASPLTVSDAPTSSAHIVDFADRLQQGGTLDALIAGLPEKRRFLDYSGDVYEVDGVEIMSAVTEKTGVRVLDDEPTPLTIGKTYSLKRGGFGEEAANASLLENVWPTGGEGCDFNIYQNSGARIGWRVDTLARGVHVELNMAQLSDSGGLQSTLIFRDLNSDEGGADFAGYDFQFGKWRTVAFPLSVKGGEIRFSIEPGDVGDGRFYCITSVRIEDIR